MPYIKQDERMQYEEPLNSLIEIFEFNKNNPGHINYVFSSIVKEVFKNNTCYAEANKLMGVLESVKQEFYRQSVAIYEDEKLDENGDI